MLTRSKIKVLNIEGRESLVSKATEEEDLIMTEPRNLRIPVYEGDSKLSIDSFLRLFEKKTEACASERESLLIDYLGGKALEFYIQHCLDVEKWTEIKENLLNYFSSVNEDSFERFVNMKYTPEEGIDVYYRKKIDIAQKLGLTEELTLEGLTSGLPSSLKNLVIVKEPQNNTEWIKIMRRLCVTAQLTETTTRPKQKYWRPQQELQSRFRPVVPRDGDAFHGNQVWMPPRFPPSNSWNSQYQHFRQPRIPDVNSENPRVTTDSTK